MQTKYDKYNNINKFPREKDSIQDKKKKKLWFICEVN